MKNICRIATAMIIVLSLFGFSRLGSIDIEYVQANESVTVDGPVSSGAFRGDLTLSHTTGTGENRLLLVGVSWGNGEAGTAIREINVIKFGEIPLDLVIEATQGFQNQVAIYRFPGEPPKALTTALFIDFSSNNTSVVVGAINFAGVNLAEPFFDISTSIGVNSLPSLEIETQDGVLVFDTISTLFTTLMPGTNQIEQWNFEESMSTNKKRGAASTQTANATTTTVSWIPGYIEPWAMAAVAIKPAQPAAPGIGDFVWIDQNGDGIQHDGEPGLPDVIVDLFQDNGSDPTLTTITDSEGHYFFDSPPAGDYYLKFSHPTTDLAFTLQNQASDDTADSDVDAFGLISVFTFTADTSNITLDAGLLMPDNPPLTATCGLDIALVIDSSLTTDENLNAVITAFQNFTSTLLPATPSHIALTDYDTTARVWNFSSNQWDDAATAENGNYWSNDLAAINSAIGSNQNDGGTNYEDALSDAHALFAFDRDENPDLILFSTHSQPDHIGTDGLSASQSEAMAGALQKVFYTKSEGIRVLSLGIGSGFDLTNLTDISGPNVDLLPIIDSDVITTDFTELSTMLETLARDMCGGTCTVHNIIDPGGDLETEDDWITEGASVANWPFDIYTSDDNISLSEGQNNPTLTNMDGHSIIYFDITSIPVSFALQETLPVGWFLLDVECFRDGQTLLTVTKTLETALIEDISFDNGDDSLTCYFYNYPSPTAVTLLSFTAKVDGDSVHLEWETASEVDNLGFNIYRENTQLDTKEKINPYLIPSQAPGSAEGALYEFVDNSAIFGQPYGYWLEAIDLNMRVKDTHGPARVLWWQFFLPIFSVSP